MSRETMAFDVIIIGAGPAGLAAAIRLLQLNSALSIVVLEKGAEVGAHIMAGAVLEPRALQELLPDWQARGAPVHTKASHDQFLILTKQHAFSLPTPRPMQNEGNYIVSLGNLCRWLAEQATALGAQIYPGFAATEILYDAEGKVCGVATGDLGINKHGEKTAQYQAGMELIAKHVLFAEGCRGSLTKQLIKKFQLDKHSAPQTYAIGIKELWRVDPKQHSLGKVIHSVGWPLNQKTYGGSFLYHLEDHQVSVGFVVGLDYENPYLNPYEEFQRFKTHPAIRETFSNAERIAYGARALVEGGFQSLPKLTVPGATLIGDTAGFLNVPKIKGIHTAMKSGMIAAEALSAALTENHPSELTEYQTRLEKSWLWDELYRVRNIRPGFQWGLWTGLAHAAIDTYLFRGKAPWTLKQAPDHTRLKKAVDCTPILYPKHDDQLTFDKLSSVQLANVSHKEDQPCHLELLDPKLAISVNLKEYDSPEQRYCPANVYEIVHNAEKEPRLQINAANCVHCKTCDIKDPLQNINWVPPEGGSGPHYSGM